MNWSWPNIKIPFALKTAIKIGISALIIFLVLKKVDPSLLWKSMKEIHPAWLLWLAAWFVFSKYLSALRLNRIFHAGDIPLPARDNLRLYWLCMYYNLLLPGGISGDGYKIKVLMQRFGASFRQLLGYTLLDRISGAVALLQLALLLLPWSLGDSDFIIPAMLALGLSVLMSWAPFKWFGGKLAAVWVPSGAYSLGVQAAQMLSVLGLVFALGQEDHWAGYLILFLLSSLAAMVPVTIGGAGARELSFLYGAPFLQINPEYAVAIGFLFYLVSTAVSLTGVIWSFKKDPTKEMHLE
ncbi:MAG TPA: lysylphosphatidylglycerol synthase transmembrane domain-containing protein [Saprospiraceae bacterium]|nr:lysylphosphatidylglycerol synthase transmembrane domain-containing protein [Saprospiraceae bacterium]